MAGGAQLPNALPSLPAQPRSRNECCARDSAAAIAARAACEAPPLRRCPRSGFAHTLRLAPARHRAPAGGYERGRVCGVHVPVVHKLDDAGLQPPLRAASASGSPANRLPGARSANCARCCAVARCARCTRCAHRSQTLTPRALASSHFCSATPLASWRASPPSPPRWSRLTKRRCSSSRARRRLYWTRWWTCLS